MAALRLYLEHLETPIGRACLATDASGLVRALEWADMRARMLRLFVLHYGPGGTVLADAPAPTKARQAVEAYFAGNVQAVAGLATGTGGTAFQRKVWAALSDIAPGKTTSYGELAARIGRPTAARAVGAANGANPIPVIVPCHRVVGADNTLTGFAGGLERKRWLLAHERAWLERRGA